MAHAKIINIQEAQRVLNYNPETGVVCWAISEGRKVVGREIKALKVKYNNIDEVKIARLIWAIMTEEQPPKIVDHRDGNNKNNRWENLRAASDRSNQYNKVKNNGGVILMQDVKRTKPYRARIRLPDGKRKNIGDFSTRIEAEEAYRIAAKKLHGDFYWGNY